MSEELIEKICHQLSLDVYRARGGKATIQWRDVPAAVRLAVEEYEASRANEMVPDIRGIAEKWSHNWTAKDISMTDCIVAAIVESLTATTSRPAQAVQVSDDVIRRVSRIVIDCDTSDGKQTGGYLSVGDLRKLKAAIEPMPAQADRTTPYTGRDQELIDSLWSGIAPTPATVATEAVAQECDCGDTEYCESCFEQYNDYCRQRAVAQGGGVDVEKVMALVEELSDALAARLGTNAEEWVVVDKARALLTAADATCVSDPPSDMDFGGAMVTPAGQDCDHHSVAQFLYGLLDDIDTATDMAKADDAAYRKVVESIQARKREVVAECDGYAVTFKTPAIAKQEARDGR